MKLFMRLKAVVTDQSRSLRDRVFILLTMVAIVIVSIAVLGDIIYGENIVEIIVLCATLALVPLATFTGVKTNRVDVVSRIISMGLILVIMPVVFLFGGGAEGAGIVWMVFSYLYIGLGVSGWWRAGFLTLLTLTVLVLFGIGYYHPELVHPHSRELFYLDVMLAVIEVGFVCFIMTWFQNRLFLEENKRAREETRKLEEFTRAQNRFFSSMSHEIRTPINSILGLNEIILRQSDATEEIIRDANNIQGSGRMLLALINDILDFSKIEAGKMDIVPVNYSLALMLSEIVNMIWMRAEQKGLKFEVEVDPQIPAELYGDEVRIKQILVNLLNNAVKYTKEGSVTLHIEKEDVKEDRILLSFSVTDTGMGIKQDALPHLFDAFRRVDEERNASIEGTGLGLSIVKQLVDLMDGRITVNSVYTQGSTFMVTLWQKVARSDAIGNLTIANFGGDREREAYRALFNAPDVTVLSVDDNEINLEVEKKLLEGTGIRVDTAQSGEEALIKTSNTRYDLILMDHLMPEMDGIECMQHIRRQTEGLNNHVPVIVLTANAGSENRELYMRSGFDDYLVKPVTGRELEDMLLKHLPENKLSINGAESDRSFRMNTLGSYSRKVPLIIAVSTACDLSYSVLKDNQIDVIPYRIHADGRLYYDTLEAGTGEVLRYRRKGTELSIEPPLTEEFEKFFAAELKKAHNVIYITAGEAVNPEYERAVKAAKAYGNVSILDSRTAAAGVGLLALAAANMISQGRSADKIYEDLAALREKVSLSCVTDESYFMNRRSIIDRGVNNLIRIMNIHPFMTFSTGGSRINGLSFGDRKSSIYRFTERMLSKKRNADKDLMMLLYAEMDERMKRDLKERVEMAGFKHVILQKVSPATAVICGESMAGFAFFEKPVDMNLGQRFETEAEYEDEITAEEPSAEEERSSRTEKGRAALNGEGDKAGEAAVTDADPGAAEPEEGLPAWCCALAGIDVERAVKNSGSAEAFRTVLKMFADSVEERSAELQDYYDREDWENYTIKVHALKSTSRLVGALGLSERAEELEAAGKAGDIAAIKEKHAAMMEEFLSYRSVLAEEKRA